MSDDKPQDPGTARPTGKRQLSGASTVSSASYEAKRSQSQRPDSNDDKPGGGVASFVPEVVSEVRKVIWPTGREMVIYTTVVFVFLILMTALVWGVDQLAALGIGAILNP